jgi:phospholipase/carboxylesterase
MSYISTRNHVAVAPRGTKRILAVPGAYGWDETADGITEAREQVDACVADAQLRFNIHPKRIFLAGHSTGGTLACRLGLENPERYAGAISLSGRVPRGLRLLRNVNRARNLPLLLSVSPTVENYTTDAVMDDVRFLHAAGMSLDVRLYPDGDDLTNVMFKDLNRWVMEQALGNGTALPKPCNDC